jgi:putative ABC transport system permease protein
MIASTGICNGALAVFDQTLPSPRRQPAGDGGGLHRYSLALMLNQRTRELGTLRANGMTRRQLFRLTLLETGLMGGIAGLMSLPVGTALAWVLVYIINVRSFGWSLHLQLRPEFYTQAVAVALLAALLAGIYPALRIGAIQPARAVRSE